MKKLLLVFLAAQFFTACQKQISTEIVPGKNTKESIRAGANNPEGQITICHREGNGSWHSITISMNALPAHIAHGDLVPDADGDGYAKTSPCGPGNDCDDNNAAIHPGATEICGNGIDDNCNELVDEGCNSVKICNLTWMLKNLDVDTYSDGTPITQIQNPNIFVNYPFAAWCYYNNDPSTNATYGKLYNWYAVAGIYDLASKQNPSLRKKLAPDGWHVASNEEWAALIECLGGESVAGGKLKETGTAHWINPNADATNESGFTALPGGYLYPNGGFYNLGSMGFWWSSTEFYPDWLAYCRFIRNGNGSITGSVFTENEGLSVRCVRD